MPDPFDETDAVLARKLAEITPPADLRARLLALESEAPAVEAAPPAWWARGIAALAAAIAIALATLSLWPHSGEPLAAATADLSTFLTNGFELPMRTPDVNRVRGWLVQNNPGQRIDLPTALARNPTIGCRELVWRDHRGSLACFSLGDGREAHLAMFPSRTFADAPGSTPKIAQAGKWTRAAWSKDGMTYLLFVPAGMDPMEELVSFVANQLAGKIASNSARSTAWPAVNVSAGVARISVRSWT
jgi:hypothetical protein